MLQEELESLLKKKGIGPEGSKSLKTEELNRLAFLFNSSEVSLTTKATILTALLTLPPTEDEKKWISEVKSSPKNFLPSELIEFIHGNTSNPFLTYILQTIHGNNLSESESDIAMNYVFNSQTSEHYIAAFLEAQRLKRESTEENKAFLNAMYKKCNRIETSMPILIDICDNYDGSNRSRSYTLFTACLLASAGFPTVTHGIDKVAPKFGNTHYDILKLANKSPLISLEKAAENLNNPDIGWAYVDQQIFFPKLYSFKKLRKEMVKRPFLATFEKLLQPIKSANGNYIVTGFTHAHYKHEVAAQLKQQGHCKQAIVLKGVEGASHLSLSKSSICIVFDGVEIQEKSIHPGNYFISELEQKQEKNITAQQSYEEGLAALKGEKNYAYFNILYLAMAILDQFKFMSPEQSLTVLTGSLNSGSTLKRWEKGNI